MQGAAEIGGIVHDEGLGRRQELKAIKNRLYDLSDGQDAKKIN